MLQTKADALWGKPSLAYHVQPHLQGEARNALGELQRAVAAHWPLPLFLCPPDKLHVTIYALVPVNGGFDKESYWRDVAEPSQDLLRGLCAGHRSLKLHFCRLKVTGAAIIAVARDESGLIETIRHRIAEILPPPPGRAPLRYDLIHATLARHRFSSPVPEAVVETIEALPISIAARIERIKIVRETLFPCLVMDEVASFPLR